MTCNTCNGLGYILTKSCSNCQGKRLIFQQNKVQVNFENVLKYESQEQIFKGFGDQTLLGHIGGIDGDLSVKIQIIGDENCWIENKCDIIS